MFKYLALGWLLCGALTASLPAQAPAPKSESRPVTADNVLLVVNEASADSLTIGRYYSVKRSLPVGQVCQIHTEPTDTISRETFEREVLQPVAACVASRSLQDKIQYIVTTKGVPLTVTGDSGPVGDLASVDSELALLYSYLAYGSLQTFGRIENPYFAPLFDPDRIRPFDSAAYGIYLVTRLTGRSVADVIFMIDRGMTAQPTGGFDFDLPSSRETTESEWFEEASAALSAKKLEVRVEDSAALLADPNPVMGYVSLAGSDPNWNPRLKIAWSPGALGIALDSDSASSFPSADTNLEFPSSSWAAQCVSMGATGFGGQVADPSLDGQIRPQIVFPAYASGYNLAESFYLGIRYLSWRSVVVGDPLTAPYGGQLLAQRGKYPVPTAIELDPETGLPKEFGKHRLQYLVERFSTTEEAAKPFLKGESLRDKGRLGEAVPWLTRSVEADPEFVAAHLLLAEALTETGEFQGAFDHYKKAVDLGNADEKTYRQLSRLALEKLNSPSQAEPYARWLLTRFGSSRPDVLLLWAEIQLDLGKLDEAEAYFAKLVKETHPPTVAALSGLGKVQYRKGRWREAKEFLEMALKQMDEQTPEGESIPGRRSALREELEGLVAACSRELDGASVTVEPPTPDPVETPEEEVEPAKVLERVLPEYPGSAKEARLEGIVVLRLLIDERGQLVKITRVYGEDSLAKAFEKAVRQWKFSPRLVRGVPQPSWLTVPLRFKLKTKP